MAVLKPSAVAVSVWQTQSKKLAFARTAKYHRDFTLIPDTRQFLVIHFAPVTARLSGADSVIVLQTCAP